MHDKRSVIISAVGRLLETGGPMTVDRVAELAGVAKGTVYLYFSSKGDLLSQALIAWTEAQAGILDRAACRHDTSSTARLSAMVTAHVEAIRGKVRQVQRLISEHPGLLQQAGDRLAADVGRAVRQLEDRYRRELEAGIAAGEFRPHDSQLVASYLLAMVNSTSASELFRPQLDPVGMVPGMLELVLDGISAAEQKQAGRRETSNDRKDV